MAGLNIPHKTAVLGQIHRPCNGEYVDAAARLAATGFAVGDLRKFYYQLDTKEVWALTGYSPITWKNIDTVPIFGTEYQYGEDLPETSSNSTEWIDKLTKTFTCSVAGEYRLGGQFGWAGSSVSYNILVDWTVDGNPLFDMAIEPKDNTSWYPESGWAPLDLTAGDHEMKIRYKVESANQTASIRNCMMEFWRIS